MAKQSGIIKLEGTIGDISFYKTQDGLLAREKGGVKGDRIKNDPSFQRTRENGNEFGNAGTAGKLLRNAFRQLIQPVADNRMVSRLTKAMMTVVKSDEDNGRGARNVHNGDVLLLKGFEFNNSGLFSTTFHAPYVATVDRVTGGLKVAVPSFISKNDIMAPTGASHFRLVSGGAAIDFKAGTFTTVTSKSQDIMIDQNPTEALNLLNQLPANSVQRLFLVLGIVFLQEVNGVNYPLTDENFNSLAIVGID